MSTSTDIKLTFLIILYAGWSCLPGVSSLCGPDYCNNAGKCMEENGNQQCACLLGYYEGERCETLTDNCAGDPCYVNQATCKSHIGFHYCICPAGYVGHYCKVKVPDLNNRLLNPRLIFNPIVVKDVTSRFLVAVDEVFNWHFKVMVAYDDKGSNIFLLDVVNTPEKSVFRKTSNLRNLAKEIGILNYKDYETDPAFYVEGTLLMKTKPIISPMLELQLHTINDDGSVEICELWCGRYLTSIEEPIEISLTGCSSSIAEPTNIRAQLEHPVSLEIAFGSKSLKAQSPHYIWSLNPVSGSSKKSFSEDTPEFMLPAFFLSGEHSEDTWRISVSVVIGEISESDQCYIRYIQEDPIVVIASGESRKSGISQDLLLDGSKSRDPMSPGQELEHVDINWDCTSTNVGSESFCKPKFSQSIVHKIPAAQLRLGHYVFTLTLSRKSGANEASAVQKVEIIQGIVPEIVITCYKNCQPKADPTSVIHLRAFCLNGDDMSELSYTWSGVSHEDTVLGLNEDRLIIKENSLGSGVEFKIMVTGVAPDGATNQATRTVSTNSAPTLKSCKVSPNEGYAATTKFIVACTGIEDEDEPVIAELHQKIEDMDMMLVTAKAHNREVRLISVLSQSSEYELSVILTDAYGMSTKEVLDELPIILPVKLENVSYEAIKDQYMDDFQMITSGIINQELIADGRTQAAMSGISALVDILQDSTIVQQADSFMDEFVEDILNMTNAIDLKDHLSAELVSVVVNKVARVSSVKQEQKLKVALLLEKVMDAFVNDPKTVGKDPEAIARRVLDISTYLMDEDIVKIDYEPSTTTVSSINKDYLFKEDYEDYAAVDPDIIDWQSSIENRTNILLNSLSRLKTVLGRHLESGEPMLTHSAKDMFWCYQINSQKGFNDVRLAEPNATDDDTSVKLTEDSVFINKAGDIEVQMIKIAKNPFWWHPNSFGMDSELVLLDISAHEEHPEEKKPIRSLAKSRLIEMNRERKERAKNRKPLDIFLKLQQKDKTVISGSVGNGASSDSDDGGITMHRISTTENASLHLTFKDISSGSIQVVIRLDQHPNSEDFFFSTTFAAGSEGILVAGDGSATDESNYFVAVRGSSSGAKTDYVIEVQNFLCRRWNEVKANWTSQGCVVGLLSKQNLAHCRCYPGSLFGASVLVAPNAIGFKRDWVLFLKLGNNLVCLVTLLVLFVLWAILMIWGGRKDRKDRSEETVIYLDNNNPDDHYCYVLVVYTGVGAGSGTTSNVAIQLLGSNATSKAFMLRERNRRVFRRGADDWFILCTARGVGELKAIRIWHDNSGRRPSWYCDRVMVRDLEERRSWTFLPRRWLSVSRGDRLLQCTIEPHDPLGKDGKPRKREKLDLKSLMATSIRDQHPWAGILARHPRSTHTRQQQITSLLSIMLANMLASMMFYGLPTGSPGDQADLGRFQATLRVFIIAIESSLVVLPLNILALKFFSKSRPREVVLDGDYIEIDEQLEDKPNIDEDSPKKKKSKRLVKYWFPWWGIYIGWTLHGIIIFISSFFILWYGLKFGKIRSLLWVTSLVLSILQAMIIIRPIKIVATSIAMVMFFNKKPEVPKPIVRIPTAEEKKKSHRYKTYIESLNERVEQKLYIPKPTEEMKLLQRKEVLRVQLASLLSDLFMFILYLSTMCWLVIGTKDPLAQVCSSNVASMITDAKYVPSVNFDGIFSDQLLIEYLNNSLLPSLFSEDWYEGQQYRGFGWLPDYSNKLLGIPRLRQLRVRNDTCSVAKSMKSYVKECYNTFAISTMDTTTYNPKWRPFINNKWHEVNKRVSQPWRFQNYWFSSSLPIMGDVIMYPAGGYISNLGRTLSNSRIMLDFLIKTDWFDDRTRALFIEFTLYNMNQNLFSVISLLAERHGVGAYVTRRQIETVKLLVHKEHLAGSVLASFFLFLIFAALFLVRTVLRVRKLGLVEYFQDHWNTLDIVLVVLSLLCIILFFIRGSYVSSLIEMLDESANNEFVSFFLASNLEQWMNYLSATLVCLATVRLWKILRFADMFRMMERTIVLAASALVSMTLILIIFIIAFSFALHLINGPYSRDFRNKATSIATLMSMIFGICNNFDFDSIMNGGRFLGVLLYFALLTVMSIYLLNAFIAVICVHFDEAKLYVMHYDRNEYTLWHYILDEGKYYWTQCKAKIRFRRFRKKRKEEEEEHFEQVDGPDEPMRLRGGFRLTDVSNDDLRAQSSTLKNNEEYSGVNEMLKTKLPIDNEDIPDQVDNKVGEISEVNVPGNKTIDNDNVTDKLTNVFDVDDASSVGTIDVESFENGQRCEILEKSCEICCKLDYINASLDKILVNLDTNISE